MLGPLRISILKSDVDTILETDVKLALNRRELACLFVLLIPMIQVAYSAPVHQLATVLEGDYSGFIPQDPTLGPRFGFSVAMHGDTLAVGAPNARSEPGGIPTGVVFIFRRNVSGWQLSQRLSHSFSNVRECGYSVALDAFNLLVGCPGAGIPDNNHGSVRRYERPSEQADFAFSGNFPVGIQTDQRCGSSVALIGVQDSGSFPFAAISCPGWDSGRGRVDIHFFCPPFFPCLKPYATGWNLAATLNPPLGVPGTPRFGQSIDFNRHGEILMLAVGQPGFPNVSGHENGRAEVFRNNATVDDWTLMVTYEGSDRGQLGSSVHMRADRLIAGAPSRRVLSGAGGTMPVGSAWVAGLQCTFNPPPTPPTCNWGSAQELLGDFTNTFDLNRLGHAVHTLVGGGSPRVIAGEPGIDNAAGRARHYQRVGTDWVVNEAEPFFPAFPAPVPADHELGSAFASQGSWLAIGAPGGRDSGNQRTGLVYLFAWDALLFRDRYEED
jgi:hypothetical protein